MRLWGDKAEHVGLPDIVWLKVNGGEIQIEKQTFKVQPFYIAKYPVTYRQFEAFVEAEDGFKNSRWWKDLSADQDHKNKPQEQNFKFYNHPRENVSWYDAIAFCRWLNSHLGWADLSSNLSPKNLGDDQGIRLPSEWEWQWAATGGNPKYEYPWGLNWDGSKANTSECGLARTTAVGMYPSGAAQCGALDMSGNVYEWCLNEYSKLENVNLRGNDSRVVRGGSWNLDQDSARAAHRLNFAPYFRFNDLGFRLVVRPPSL
jgi:formylglycine-generating enzyme required for sulfatase activity